jgi:hypothetical protein
MQEDKLDDLMTYINRSLHTEKVTHSYIGETDYYQGHLNLLYTTIESNDRFIIAVVDDYPYGVSMKGVKLLVKHIDNIGSDRNYYQHAIEKAVQELQIRLKRGDFK